MSEDNGVHSEGPASALARHAPLAATGIVLLVSVVSMFLVISLMGDVAALHDQGRRAAKATKALQEEVGALRETLHQFPKPAPAPTPVEAKPTNIDAVDTRNDCVIRTGDKSGVAGCIGIEPKGK